MGTDRAEVIDPGRFLVPPLVSFARGGGQDAEFVEFVEFVERPGATRSDAEFPEWPGVARCGPE